MAAYVAGLLCSCQEVLCHLYCRLLSLLHTLHFALFLYPHIRCHVQGRSHMDDLHSVPPPPRQNTHALALHVCRSSKLWAFYADLEESLGTLESASAVYNTMLDLRVATPQIILNYALMLQVRVGRCLVGQQVQKQGGPSRAWTECLLLLALPPQYDHLGSSSLHAPGMSAGLLSKLLTCLLSLFFRPCRCNVVPASCVA